MPANSKPTIEPAEPTMQTVSALKKEGTVEAAERLLDLTESSPKPIAKAARTALYHLKLAGIEPAPRAPAAPPAELFKPPQSLAHRAWLTTFGGRGTRLILFQREDPYGGSPFLLTFLLDSRTGIQDLGGRKLGRKQIDERIANMGGREGAVLAEIPIDYGRWVLQQAAKQNADSRTPIPKGYADWSAMIGAPEQAYEISPVFDLIDREQVKSNLAISHNPENLFENPPFVGWMLDLDEIDPWEERFFASQQQSNIVLDKSQVAERGERIIDEATDALIPPELISDYRTRLEETAYVLQMAGREEQARETLYHALDLRETLPAHAQPFLRALVKRSIFVMIALKAEQEPEPQDEETSLIARV